MLEIIEFVLGSFWRWLGTLILVATISSGVGGLIHVVIKRKL